MLNVKADFPALSQKINGNPLFYLDSAASTIKARPVIDRVAHFLGYEAANVHRGAYSLSDNATALYEAARNEVRGFLNAKDSAEIIFVRNTTEGMNLVASSLGKMALKPGDEILLTELEHHSNIVPWQLVAEQRGAVVRAAKVTPSGEIDIEDFQKKLTGKTKIVSLQILSNALGTNHPVEKLVKMVRSAGAYVVLDAAQAVSSVPVDVQALDCDFLAFSGHKLFAPDGIGVVYGKQALLNAMPPFLGGGSMIDKVTFEKTTFLNAPSRFEAGTPNVSGAVGLAEAIRYLRGLGYDRIHAHEKALLEKAEAGLKSIEGVTLIGANPHRHNVVSFLVKGLHPSDVGFFLNKQGVCVRAGHHCCQPLMAAFGIAGTVRASFSIYNTAEDVDALVAGVKKSLEFV